MSYLSGKSLEKAVNTPSLGCSPQIEELAFEDTVIMFSSQPGVGKSVVTTNMCASISSKSPVFGFFETTDHYKTAYLQMEGSRDEQLSRLKCLEDCVKINYDNISWHTTPIISENTKSWDTLLKELEEIAPFQFLFLDPIYKATMYGLKREESVLSLIKLLDTIRSEFKPTIILNNHETKETYSHKGVKIEKDDPFYGSQWLKAYVDVSFNIKQSDKNEINLIQKKDRTNSIIKNFFLQFDPSSYYLKFIMDKSDLSARYKVSLFLKKNFDKKKFVTTSEIARETGVSKRHILRMKADRYFDDIAGFNQKDELHWIPKI